MAVNIKNIVLPVRKEIERCFFSEKSFGDIINKYSLQSFFVGSGCDTLGVAGIAAEMVPVSVVQLRMISKLCELKGSPVDIDIKDPSLIIKLVYMNIGITGIVESGNRIGLKYVPRMISKLFKTKNGRKIFRKYSYKLIPVVSAFIGGYMNYIATKKIGEKTLEYFNEKEGMDLKGGNICEKET